ncbi:MAG: PAS domain-containing protein [Steroidobacteraceae bacterium]|jgi:PAS domain-containing protein
MGKLRTKDRSPGQRALDASGDGFWELNLLDGSAWFSDWFYTQLQWSEERKPNSWESLRPAMRPDGWVSVLREMREHLEEHQPFDIVVPIQAPDGDERWWQIRGSAERDEGRQPHYLSGIARDVSAERAAFAALTQELTWLREGFDVLPLAAGLIDDTGVVVYLNRRWRELASENALLGEQLDVGKDYLRSWGQGPVSHPAGLQIVAGLQGLLRGDDHEFVMPYEIRTTTGPRRMRLRARLFETRGRRQIAIVHADH